jgi:hypothetical protein
MKADSLGELRRSSMPPLAPQVTPAAPLPFSAPGDHLEAPTVAEPVEPAHGDLTGAQP